VAATGGSAARRRPATAHVQPRNNRGRPRVTQDEFMLHMQHEVGQRLNAPFFSFETGQNLRGAFGQLAV
jgi:hypothetical protein